MYAPMMKKSKFSYLEKKRYLSNDDIGMLKEKTNKKKDNLKQNICDTHIDGA